jgi:hypothetical protein
MPLFLLQVANENVTWKAGNRSALGLATLASSHSSLPLRISRSLSEFSRNRGNCVTHLASPWRPSWRGGERDSDDAVAPVTSCLYLHRPGPVSGTGMSCCTASATRGATTASGTWRTPCSSHRRSWRTRMPSSASIPVATRQRLLSALRLVPMLQAMLVFSLLLTPLVHSSSLSLLTPLVHNS